MFSCHLSALCRAISDVRDKINRRLGIDEGCAKTWLRRSGGPVHPGARIASPAGVEICVSADEVWYPLVKGVVMKSAVALLVLSAAAAAQTPDANQILRDVQEKYASLQTYSSIGEVRGVITMSAWKGGAAPKPEELLSKFTIKLARPQMYQITWRQESGFFNNDGALWSDGGQRFLRMLAHTEQPADTEEAFAGATGISGGAANTIPSIFFDFSTNQIKALKNPVRAGEESIEGDACYVIKSHDERFDRTFWISKETKLIRQERTDTLSMPDFEPPEMTDEILKKALEMGGKEATPEAIQAMRDMMAAAQKMQKTMPKPQSSSSIETHHQIKVDEPMTAGDFTAPTAAAPKSPQS
jgi:hypothetical protein